MKAVSVWDHCLSDREILARRLSEGWEPTASQLREGDRIQGFAACVFDSEYRTR